MNTVSDTKSMRINSYYYYCYFFLLGKGLVTQGLSHILLLRGTPLRLRWNVSLRSFLLFSKQKKIR